MAPSKAISAAFVAFLCLCSQALATKEFDYYSLVLMWPASFCFHSSAGCCVPTTGKPALDFFVTGLQTRNSTTGEVVTKCKQSNFNVNALADLIDDLYAYWSTIKCPSTNALPNWKNSWKTSGVCSGLSEHNYFKTALELRKKLNLLSIFKKNGIVPSGENFYNVEYIKKVIKKTLGVSVAIECNKNMWDESQFYQIYICFDKDASTIISCPNVKASTCAKEVTFGLFTYDMLVNNGAERQTLRTYTS
ncbi:extracellular ribonuclease LE-like protein [Cinnamomum micranthum f. kanehirae]|uniref:Extracellular ribonuclease LE-like protein n=1 Tax=Cinnamomum micranthum f. kanehirae TaxID=337451 RepID=A0A443NLJ7_9MAGN|nr:extracellular ribonuclease LE-like protein [Cinnamomum micranthum f. kanehirae]